jgi:L-ascorbate metabolism protein UlaG (beta-lactamase superfamily)
LTKNTAHSVPERALDVQMLSRDALLAAPDNSLWRLGHSTVLLKLENEFWLTDPVFSERASSSAYFGPKRFHPPPISVSELPPIEAVIVSHDHYDHLDRKTIISLIPHTKRFVTPLGVGDRLIAWGVPAAKVQQLDWWQETSVGPLRLVALPAQHFSGRSIGDSDRTLWASWALITPRVRVFFSGDTGYFSGFRSVGERFGPFDLTMIETGAYDREWPGIHMTPEDSVRAHVDLQGRSLLPIHDGTFDLAFHPWTEPFERVLSASKASTVAVLTPRFGERVSIVDPAPTTAWWR